MYSIWEKTMNSGADVMALLKTLCLSVYVVV